MLYNLTPWHSNKTELNFSELPEHILTNDLVPKFEEASGIKDQQHQEEVFLSLIKQLPPLNKLLLSWLMVHIDHVIEKVSFQGLILHCCWMIRSFNIITGGYTGKVQQDERAESLDCFLPDTQFHSPPFEHFLHAWSFAVCWHTNHQVNISNITIEKKKWQFYTRFQKYSSIVFQMILS